MRKIINNNLVFLLVTSLVFITFPMTSFAAATTVTVGTQSGALTAGTGGSATFSLTTDATPDVPTVTITWCDSLGTPGATPTGLSAAAPDVSTLASTITVTATTAAVGGTYYFKATVDSAESLVATVTVDSVISTAPIAGVTAPVTGATPVATIAATTEYTATISWSPADATFAPGTDYTATITITPKTGYTLTGVTQDFFTVAGATATNAADSGVVTAVFPTTALNVISTAPIAGVTAPVTGATPVSTIAATTEYTAAISWSPADATFAPGTDYTATITVTPKTGYTLTGVTQDFFTVAGATATNAADSGVVTAVFPTTALNVISTAPIAGVTAPVTGATPVSTIAATTEYTAAISWSPADATFAPGTDYTATITVTPKTGYTLTGVTQDFFTVAGATATNAADSGVVTAVFPTTALNVISTAPIAGVTAPVTGATPVATIAATTEYTATISWSPADATFAPGTDYTATITITPKTGYTLTGVTQDFFTVAGATATNAADSGVVTAVFPTTASLSKTALTAAITAEIGADHSSPAYVLTQSYYTPATWATYTGAISSAIVVENNASATQTEIDNAITAISDAKTALSANFTLSIGSEAAGGAGFKRDITITNNTGSTLSGKYLIVQYTAGTGTSAKVSVVMIEITDTTTLTTSYQVAGTKVEVWLASGMPDLTATNMGVTLYADASTN